MNQGTDAQRLVVGFSGARGQIGPVPDVEALAGKVFPVRDIGVAIAGRTFATNGMVVVHIT